MHHVPIVAYSDGRSAYARVLIEIAANVELLKSLIIDIPLGVDKGKSSKTNNGVTNKESTDRGPIQIMTKNSFSALSKETDTNLKDKECVNAVGQTPVESQFVNDSDEDVDEYITMKEPSKAVNNNQG
nr:hypothetical protein [Tanacetum cinerariifolium]